MIVDIVCYKDKIELVSNLNKERFLVFFKNINRLKYNSEEKYPLKIDLSGDESTSYNATLEVFEKINNHYENYKFQEDVLSLMISNPTMNIEIASNTIREINKLKFNPDK